MSTTQVSSETAIETPRARRVDMKLEVVVIPVSDVDRAKHFYGSLGWRLELHGWPYDRSTGHCRARHDA
jgi:hypothetical protein